MFRFDHNQAALFSDTQGSLQRRQGTPVTDNVFRRFACWLALAGIVIATTVLLSPIAWAQAPETIGARMLFGVGTHQGLGGAVGNRGYLPADSLRQIRELGMNSFRDDFSWSDFEQSDGRMSFMPHLARLDAQLRGSSLRPVLILGQGHHLVPNSLPPTTDEARARFIGYVRIAARAVAEKAPILELWNEWNIAARDNSAFNADNYLVLAQLTYPVVKEVAPGATFVIGAIGDDAGWRWTNSLIDKGLLKFADGVSIHLYNHCNAPARRTSAEIVERLTVLHHMLDRASGRPNYPVYLTETGWPTMIGKCGVSEQRAADNMAQLLLWSSTASAWLKGVWLYELKDSGINPAEIEDHFGLYGFDNMPKPAACAVRDTLAFVRDALMADLVSTPHGVVGVRITTAGGQGIALWASDPSRRFEMRLRGEIPGARTRTPCDTQVRPLEQQWVAIGGRPTFIEVDAGLELAFDIRAR